MHILHTTAVNQTIAFIPRAYVGIVNVDLYDTNRKSTISFSASTIAEDGYLKITNSYSLEEGNFYHFNVYDLINNLLYRGQIFCTDQNDYKNYDMNISRYTTNNDKDTIIII